MRYFGGNISKKILSIVLLFTFFSSNLTVANSTELSNQNISPPWIIAEAPSPEREAFQNEVMSHWMYNYVFFAIFKFLSEEQGNAVELKKFLKEKLSGREKDARDMYVFIDEITISRGKVKIPFKKNEKKRYSGNMESS